MKINFLTMVILVIVFTMFCPAVQVFAQSTGTISGKVVDKSNNDALIGANVIVEGTTLGAATDIDGFYTIKNLKPGSYKLRFSFISYQSLTVENVIVKANENTAVNVSLSTDVTTLKEVIITAEALKTTEASVLKIQKTAENIVDGISAELISKNNSSNGVDILKKMTGVTISEGKYAFIRGIGDRYNSTLLNGSTLPSTDPEKKSFSYDIFPASLIENVITAKTFTPDEPGDFSGGLVQIKTIEFPTDFIFNISTSGAFNSMTTGEKFLTYSGGSKDFLGYDDGTRAMPSMITAMKVVRGNYPDSALNVFTGLFKNNWSPYSVNAPMDGSFKIDIGDKYELGSSSVFGFVGSLTYSNSGKSERLQKSFYDFSGPRYLYDGTSNTRSVNLGALLNLSFKFANKNKISFKNIYNQDADDITTFYKGDYRYSDQYREITSFDYISRSLLSDQLIGEHEIGMFNGLIFKWNLSYAESKRNEPDARRYVYARSISDPSESLRFQLDPSGNTRYYGDLKDQNYNVNLDFIFKLFNDPELPKIKVGLAYNKKDRNFSARSFGFRNIPGGNYLHEDSVLRSPVYQIFQPENIGNRFIQVQEVTKLSDSYLSNQKIKAGYFIFDATVFNRFRIVAGARFENSTQELNTIDLRDQPVNVKNTYKDILPSINLTYLLNDRINIRTAFSITLARPEFREMAPFSYFDFIANELVQGNPLLQRALINNYDVRFEIYPGPGELAALSFFYKRFKSPIEETVQASANEPIRSFVNADMATNYGLEIELRKSLTFISPIFEHLSFIGNAALINSRVQISNNVYQQSERALQGQAPYIFNLGLYYDNYHLGLNTSLTYNKVGQRISKVGTKDLGNTLEKPVDLIDFTISKTAFEFLTFRFSVKDILNQDRIQIQQAPYGDKVTSREIRGRNISFGVTYKL